MNATEAREAYLKARRALENSAGRLCRAFIASASRLPQVRRPLGSPPNYVIPRERFSPQPEFGSSFRLARFDPKSGKIMMTSMGSTSRSMVLPEVDPESFVVDVWDRVAFELHLNCFAAYVDALFQYARLAPQAEELAGEKDVLRTAIAAAVNAEALPQQLGLGAHSDALVEFAKALSIDRVDKALREYGKLKSPETATVLMTALAEAMPYHPAMENEQTLLQALRAVNEFLGEEMR